MMRLTPEERRGYESYLKDLRIEDSVSDTYYADGKKDGFEQGKKTQKEMALNMAKPGIPLEQIIQISELSKEEVKIIIASS
jgi:predicted transposase/invertase (TIGR01784 family)